MDFIATANEISGYNRKINSVILALVSTIIKVKLFVRKDFWFFLDLGVSQVNKSVVNFMIVKDVPAIF